MTTPDIFSPEYAADPHPTLADFRENHPVTFHEGLDAWVISRYEDIDKVLKDPVFTTRNYAWQLEPVHGKTILQLEGGEHRKMRGIVNPALRGEDLQSRFVPVIDRNAKDLIDTWRSDGKVDLVDQFTTRFPINVILDMLGLDKKDHDLFHGWYNAIIAYFTNLTGDKDVIARGLRTKQELQAYVLPEVANRRENPRDDLITTIIQSEIEGEYMTDMEVKSFVSFLLVAAGETTDKAVSNMFLQLIQHPEQMQAVRDDRSLIDAAFAESLRHTPVVLMVMREPSEDVEFHGQTIPAGSTMVCLLAAANRDPRRFDNPDAFDIFRKDLDVAKAFAGGANHMTFALGRHFCVGSILAQYEVRQGTNQLLDAMGDIKFADGQPPEEAGIFVRAPKTMPLTYTPLL